jgi:NTE family protein
VLGAFYGHIMTGLVSPYQFNPFNVNPLREILASEVNFARLRAHGEPRLFVSATHVATGRLRVFTRAELDTDNVLASACLPTLFHAVRVDGHDYWDGVFAQNPPVRELPDVVRTLPGGRPPDDIWVIRINPQARDTVPQSMVEIRDRRNELAGIISLSQELHFIDFLNWLIDQGKLAATKDGKTYRKIELRSVRVGDDFARRLNYHSKRDRSRGFLQDLERHGVQQAEAFLRDPGQHREPAAPPRQ